MISKLQDELIASRNQLLQLRSFAPQNPQIPVLRTKIAGLSHDIDSELNKVAGNRQSLSASAAQFQRYQLESQVTDKQLAASISSLEDARNEARRKQAYVERIEQPSIPDSPDEPKRLRGILAALMFGLIALRNYLDASRRHSRTPRLIMNRSIANGTLRRSFQIQRLQVVWALILREILTRYGRHNIGFLWLFVEPMLPLHWA